MRSMSPDPEIRVQEITIPAGRRRIPALVLSPTTVPVRLPKALSLSAMTDEYGTFPHP